MFGNVNLRRSEYPKAVDLVAAALAFVGGQIELAALPPIMRGLKAATSVMGSTSTSLGISAGLAFQKEYKVCCENHKPAISLEVNERSVADAQINSLDIYGQTIGEASFR